ncbi:MAG TPA: antitoxin Xre/MbcA/ParS toxin-binding domain-containing protein [Puia sp.]|nr:antitoxin Xre/MbcA/ParS toxin-binding domain-containing protein [Puia sp.]
MAKSYKNSGNNQKSGKGKPTVSETNVAYKKPVYRNSQTGKFVEQLDYSKSIPTTMEKMEISKEGITKKELELLKTITDLDYATMAKILSVTRATLINKKKEERFNGPLSERIVGLADLYAYGKKVFGDPERFNAWMSDPNKALGGKMPLEIIDNQYGREEVKNILGRIEYGVYS